jgi:hypothetical protein
VIEHRVALDRERRRRQHVIERDQWTPRRIRGADIGGGTKPTVAQRRIVQQIRQVAVHVAHHDDAWLTIDQIAHVLELQLP